MKKRKLQRKMIIAASMHELQVRGKTFIPKKNSQRKQVTAASTHELQLQTNPSDCIIPKKKQSCNEGKENISKKILKRN
jgi:hypothetical protein